MAHIISLPTQFEFIIWPMKWIPAKARLDSWSFRQNKVWELVALVLEPPHLAGYRFSVRREAMSTDVWRRVHPEGRRLSADLRRHEFEALLYFPPDEEEQSKAIDPWRVRNEFLSLRSTSELLKFLNKYGTWDENEVSRRMWFFPPSRRQHPRIAYPADFWTARDELRERLIHDVGNWQHGKLDFAWRSEFPHYRHVDNDCLRAIKTATTIDLLRNVRFKICAREDCGKPFPAERKGKQYCQQYCAHIVSVRKMRSKHARRRPKPRIVRG